LKLKYDEVLSNHALKFNLRLYTSERAIPVSIFQAEPAVARSFLREWTKDTVAGDPSEIPDMRLLVDWAGPWQYCPPRHPTYLETGASTRSVLSST